MTSIFLHGPGSWGLHRANEVPRSHRQAAVISPRSSRASHRQYLTIPHSAQQQAGVERDPSPTRRVAERTGRIRSNGPSVSIEQLARSGADAIERAAGRFPLSIYCGSGGRRMGCSLWRSCGARLRSSYVAPESSTLAVRGTRRALASHDRRVQLTSVDSEAFKSERRVRKALSHMRLTWAPARSASRLDHVRTSREKAMKAVRFDQYGGVDVLKVVDAPVPEPGQGEALIKVKAASINPGEAKIREGLLHARWPATFPSGEGSDIAGIVTKIGAGVEGFNVGDEVFGFTDRRASHAEYVIVEAQNLTRKPANVSWEVAGALAVAGSTAYASVRAVSLKPGDAVAVSGAAGGVGSIAVQLAKRAEAEVIGIASPANHNWLAAHGIKQLAYQEGLFDLLREARIKAFIDTHGGGYVKLAIEFGVAPDRINTIIDFAAAK